ncbi:MAG: prepilin-type N-terminal cleavage/methylation domain-containing protein [Planctomycetes bacterium]|nr:prepilin-type N-terminal cleavage/methylation domain-containing protein [Planctomycetota bacterium]
MNRQRGFTLIELLVVIAIIVLLMGILMPALQRARKQSKGVVCRSNLKQIGMAANLYGEDHDLFIPRSAGWSTISEMRPWFQCFMPYLAQKAIDDDYRNVKIFRCPGYPDKEQTLGYVVNGWPDKDDTRTWQSKLTECEQPATTIYLTDNEDGPWRTIIKKATDRDLTRCDVWTATHLPDSDSQDITTGRRVARARHKKGCNVLYLDWHVGWMAAEEMTEEMWHFEK